MRLDTQEREALRFALKDFKGEVYLFGSRLDNTAKGIILWFETQKDGVWYNNRKGR